MLGNLMCFCTLAMLQDLDVDLQLQLDPASYDGLMAQLESDCELLERLKVMDYSLLLGVHYLDWGDGTWHPPSVAVSGVLGLFCATPGQAGLPNQA